jgi:peptidoglycan/LPS O-acetylase OafA/YrhL
VSGPRRRFPWLPSGDDRPPTNRQFAVALAALVVAGLAIATFGIWGEVWVSDPALGSTLRYGIFGAAVIIALVAGPVVRRRVKPPPPKD